MYTTNIKDSQIIDLTRFSSINQDHASPETSSRYSFIPTNRVIDILATKNWTPSKISQSRVNDETKEGFQKHMIRFRNESFTNYLNFKVGDSIPEIVMTNAHNRLGCFNLFGGIFKLACLNGLMVSDCTIANQSIRHTGFTNGKVLTAIEDITSSIPIISNKMAEFKAIELKTEEQRILAESSLLLNYDAADLDEKFRKEDSITALLQPRRSEDKEPTLWNTFNTIQEKIIKGGRYMIEKDARYMSDSRKIRQITQIDKNVKINKALWTLTEKMAELKK